jgi:hypothetical protein
LKKEDFNIDYDSATVVKEFDYVINSVIAHNKFDKYLNEVEEAKLYLPYWNIFQSIRIIAIIEQDDEYEEQKKEELIEPHKATISDIYRKNFRMLNNIDIT